MRRRIRLSESDLHRIVEQVINEIGDTERGQNALGQVHGRARVRQNKARLRGDKEKERKYRKIAVDAEHKAYDEAESNGLFAGINSSFDNGVNNGYNKGRLKEESLIRKAVKESVKRVLRENDNDEFEYGDSEDLGKGKHRQTIIYNGKEVGFLLTIETNWLAPLQEKYIIPDIEYGMDIPQDNPENNYINVKNPFESDLQPVGRNGLMNGKRGWIDYKVFTDYDEAFQYVKTNFDLVVYLFEYGDYD